MRFLPQLIVAAMLGVAGGWDLRSVFFPNASIGYAVGMGGVILRTVDGGDRWVPCPSGIQKNLHSVHFANPSIGYAVGDSGTIVKTTDGGSGWSSLTSGKTVSLRSVFFLNVDTGYIVGDAYTIGGWFETILKTVDGGVNWSSHSSGNGNHLRAVHFPSPTTGYAVGGGTTDGLVLSTKDGGITWGWQMPANARGLDGVFFINADTGYAVSEFGSTIKTVNGGISWVLQSTGGGGNAVHFTDAENGFIVTGSMMGVPVGGVLQTVNGGAAWNTQGVRTITNAFFSSVHFPVSDTGYIVARDGAILKTANAGLDWTAKLGSIDTGWSSPFFLDSTTGYSVGMWGSIRKTTDGGRNWVGLFSGTKIRLNDIHCPSSQVCYAIGGGLVLKTVDAGMNWESQGVGTVFGTEIHCPSDSVCYGIFSFGMVWKTTDAGSNWYLVHSFGSLSLLTSVWFTTESIGHVTVYHQKPCGSCYESGSSIYRTSDGGVTWNQTLRPSCPNGMYFNTNVRITRFTGVDTGYALSNCSSYVTTDGGLTWRTMGTDSVAIGIRTESKQGPAINRFGIGAHGYLWYFLTYPSNVEVRALDFIGRRTRILYSGFNGVGRHTLPMPVGWSSGYSILDFRVDGNREILQLMPVR